MRVFSLVSIAAVTAVAAQAQTAAPQGDLAFRARIQAEQNYKKDDAVQEIQREFRESVEGAKRAYAQGDFVSARRLWLTIAEAGVPMAQMALASLYERGLGGERDSVQAAEWLRKAADQSYGPAEFALGMSFLTGRGVPKDPQQGAKLIQKAANHGVPQAKFNMGVLFEHGEGVPKDVVTAADWYRKAAKAGVKVSDTIGVTQSK